MEFTFADDFETDKKIFSKIFESNFFGVVA